MDRWNRNLLDFGNTALENTKTPKPKWCNSWFTWSQGASEISALGHYFAVQRLLSEPEEIERGPEVGYFETQQVPLSNCYIHRL